MKIRQPATTVFALITATTIGCAPDRAPEPEAPAPLAIETPAQPATLSPEALELLKQQYPVLREERAPEPQPSPDASPRQTPDWVREVAPATALRTVTGQATFYADTFEGRRTASGIPFRQNQMVAAHKAFPFGTVLRVTNTRNNRSVNVRVVDRGPYNSTRETIIDLSRRAASQLGYIDAGRAPVRVEVLEWGEGTRSG
ncbi:hypothetical protein BH23GEM3_BH23GEM3_03320 [soil metagenome]|nr:septal ring lytic transglycosylase RlpA family protein [Gemmatimonadota bacterium]